LVSRVEAIRGSDAVGEFGLNDHSIRLKEVHALVRGALLRGDSPTARQACERVLEQCPSDLISWYLVGQAYLAQQQWDESCAAFEHVVIRDPEHVRALTALGLAHLSTGRPEAATTAFERAYDLQPTFDQARSNLAALRPDLLDDTGVLPTTTPLATLQHKIRTGQLEACV